MLEYSMDPTNGVPNFFEKDRSMTYKRVAVFDNRGEDLLQHLESCISFIEQVFFAGSPFVFRRLGPSFDLLLRPALRNPSHLGSDVHPHKLVCAEKGGWFVDLSVQK